MIETRFKDPSVFLIAETRLVGEDFDSTPEDAKLGVHGFLTELGVPDWTTDSPSDAEKLIEISGKTCYLSFSTDLNKNLTRTGGRNNLDYIQQGLVATKHGSCLEHATVTFVLMNISRVCSHELVRHRAGCAYSQVSGRYVRCDKIDSSQLPSVIAGNPEAVAIFEKAFTQMEENVQDLTDLFALETMKKFGLKKIITSAMRRIVGNGQANHIVFTANHRALRHILVERTSIWAEEEIRVVFLNVFDILKNRYPNLYHDMIRVTPNSDQVEEGCEALDYVVSTGVNKI